ncbi:MAG: DUF1559 domain-containing protein [Planctomycetia bacterium]|nr:DUF1559 domain-containing protein [Planctomycetia bacterium]
MPAVQAAREAARRMQCTNNMKQLALSVHTYHDVYNSVPGFGWGPNQNYSPHVGLLPMLEQAPRADQINSVAYQYNDGSDSQYNPYNASLDAWKGPISAFLCPSDGKAKAGAEGFAANNYCWSRADYEDEYYGQSGSAERNTRTLFAQTYSGSAQSGWCIPASYNFSACIDGLSNTVMLSERCASPATGLTTTVVDNMVKGGILSGDSTHWYNPAACMEYQNGPEYANYPAGTPVASQGTYYGYYGHNYARFNTITPPNSPSCSYEEYNPKNDASVYPPTSYHSGGVNVAMADGSVHFISDTIATDFSDGMSGRKQKYDGYSGASSFGVWGALGSINGGEAAMLP